MAKVLLYTKYLIIMKTNQKKIDILYLDMIKQQITSHEKKNNENKQIINTNIHTHTNPHEKVVEKL